MTTFVKYSPCKLGLSLSLEPTLKKKKIYLKEIVVVACKVETDAGDKLARQPSLLGDLQVKERCLSELKIILKR